MHVWESLYNLLIRRGSVPYENKICNMFDTWSRVITCISPFLIHRSIVNISFFSFLINYIFIKIKNVVYLKIFIINAARFLPKRVFFAIINFFFLKTPKTLINNNLKPLWTIELDFVEVRIWSVADFCIFLWISDLEYCKLSPQFNL